jgi:hypothetical protein
MVQHLKRNAPTMNRLSPGYRRLFLGVFLVLFALGTTGCGRSGKVSGTVKYNGKLLTSGFVVLVDEANRPVPPAYIQTDGTYLVPTAPVGSMKILINTPPPQPPEIPEKESPEYKEYEAKLAAYVSIPTRYQDLEKSGKTFKVKSGDNVCDIELEGEKLP